MNKNLLLYQSGINRRLILSLLISFITVLSAFAQSRQIQGKITSSEDNSSIPGASILIKGTTTGTVTDANGNFSLTVPGNNAVIVISYLGFTTEEVTVGSQTSITVSLVPDITALGEVVVIGYGTQQRKDLTGSVSSVSAKEIEKVPVNTIDQAIQGRSPGVQVTSNDGSPGAGVSIKIRGVGSFGDNSPLYVVDGYPISGGLNTINPSDIATIDILKDASATAIYGSRASNGVVIITTKRGKKDGLQVSFDATASFQSQPKKYDVLNAQQFANLAVEIADADGNPGEALPEWRNPSSLVNIDWQDEIYRPGLRQNYNLGIQGGNEKTQASFSLGFLDHKGVVLASDFKRYNATLNVDLSPFKWLKSSSSLKYTRTEGETRFGSGLSGLSLLTRQIPTMSGNPLTQQVKDGNGNYGYYPSESSAAEGLTNIVQDIETQDRQRAGNNILASTSMEVTLFEGFRVKSNFGINVSDNSGYYFTPQLIRGTDTTQAFYSQNATNTYEWLWENTVAYNRTFGIHSFDFVGGISAQENTFRQIGTEGNGQVSDRLRDVGAIRAISVAYGNQSTWSLASQFARLTYKLKDRYILTGTVRRDGSSRFGPGNRYGIFPSVAAAWRIKEEGFLKNINAVSDFKLRGSWGQAGNQNIALFRYLGTYGTGPNKVDNRDYVFGTTKALAPGIVLKALPNPNLTWETTTQSNIGLDAAFLNNKVTLSFDYYNRKSEDFLLDIEVPVQTGFPTAARNVGSIRNSGIEIGLSYRESEKAFQWGIGANITTVKNEILDLGGSKGVSNFSPLNFPNFGGNTWRVFSQSRVGGEVGAFYGFQSAGIFQSDDEVEVLNAKAEEINGDGTYYLFQNTQAGDRNFVDQITVDTNGDGVPDARDGRITDDDRVNLGSPLPKFFGGLNFDASYKNFDFTMFWYASVGNKILNYAKRNLESLATNGGVGIQNVSVEYYNNRWTEANPSTEYTRAVLDDQNGNTRVSDAYIEDGSFLRLRTIQLGYSFPVALLTKAYITRARLFISAQNLVTITKYSGLDPEIGEVSDPSVPSGDTRPRTNVTATGIDIGNYPNPRGFTVGLNLTF